METEYTCGDALPRRRTIIASGGAALLGGLLATSTTAEAGAAVSMLFDCPLSPTGEYVLPPLPYAYNALEPHLDEQTMKLHHDIHHNSYVTGLNNALKRMADARTANDYALVKHWEREAAFHGSGHFLHVIFWNNMAAAGSTTPGGGLMELLAKDFGSFDAFKAHFSAAAGAVEGSGWGILGYQGMGKKLVILQSEKHQNLTQWGIIPILALDVWEHAYYLKYQNRRPAYITAWWNVVNWKNVEDRLMAAKMMSG